MLKLKFIDNNGSIKALIYEDLYENIGPLFTFNIQYYKYDQLCLYLKESNQIAFGNINIGFYGTLHSVIINFYNNDRYIEIRMTNILDRRKTIKYIINYDYIDLKLYNDYMIE